MLSHLSKAVAQLGDPRLRRVLVIGILGSLFLFVLLSGAIWVSVTQFDLSDVPVLGWLQGLLGWAFDLIAGFLLGGTLLTVSLLLFPGVATIIVGFFLEEVVTAGEDRHYPTEPPARPQPTGEVFASTVKFAVLVIGLNILVLPLYLLLFFAPPFNLILYYLLNGYLISREYFELVAFRRMEPMSAGAMRRRNRGRVLMAGILLTFLLTIPVVNFLTPVLATAFMVHVFHGLPGRQEILPA